MRRITALITVLALAVASCGDDDAGSVEETPATTPAVQRSVPATVATIPQPVVEEAEIDVKVVFDGEVCSYFGPAVIPANNKVRFDFNDNAYPAMLIIGQLDDGVTWDQVLEASGPGKARVQPLWIHNPLAISPGTRTVTLGPADWFVGCATAPDDTDAMHPAAIIELVEG